MNLINNLDTLTQTHFDSGSLGGLASVVHRMTERGQYGLVVLHTDQPVHTTALMVQDATTSTATAHAAASPSAAASSTAPQFAPGELQINLRGLVSLLGQLGARLPEFAMAITGYAVFHAPAGTSGYAVQLHSPNAPDKPPIFDSRRLGNNDIFSTTVFRPGRYTVTNQVTNVQGQLRVAYPVISNTPYQPPDPVKVQLDQTGFSPKDIQIMPAQGIVIHIGNTQARIVIDLVEPDDGPSKPSAPVTPATSRSLPSFRWVKPQPPG